MTHIDNSTVQSRWQTTVDHAEKQGQSSGIKDWFKSTFTKTPTRTESQVGQTAQQFTRAFGENVQKLGRELGLNPKEMQALKEKGDKTLQDIVKSTFGFAQNAGVTKNASINKQALDIAVLTANTLGTRMVTEFRSENVGPPRPPSITPFKDSEGNYKLNVMKNAPQLETLVLRGGGAKGVGNAPALVELEKAGRLDGLKQVVGTSAGALTAVGLASGMNAQEFQDLANRIDFAGLKAKPEHFATKYPSDMVQFGLTGYHAGTALETLDRESATSVKNYLDANWSVVTKAKDEGRIDGAAVTRLSELRNQNFDANRTGQMITFKDLAILHDVAPSKFKQLTLTAWNDTDKSLKYMDAEKTPDMPIALAGRMSMSIPVYFASVKYDFGGGTRTWTDGGVGSNMPGGYVFDKLEGDVTTARNELEQAKLALFRSQTQSNADTVKAAQDKLDKALDDLSSARQRTMLMTFDDEGAAYKKMHGAPPKGGKKTSLFGRIGGNKYMPQVRTEDARQVREGGLNTIAVFHGKMGTLSLDASPSEKAFASLTARMRALEYVEQRQHQQVSDTFTDATRAARSLTPQERAGVLQSGVPSRDDFDDPKLFQLALDFHTEVQRLHGGA